MISVAMGSVLLSRDKYIPGASGACSISTKAILNKIYKIKFSKELSK
jgi:hypothetical protein